VSDNILFFIWMLGMIVIYGLIILAGISAAAFGVYLLWPAPPRRQPGAGQRCKYFNLWTGGHD